MKPDLNSTNFCYQGDIKIPDVYPSGVFTSNYTYFAPRVMFLIQIFLAHYNKYFPAGVPTPGAGSRRGTRTRCWTTRPCTPAPSAGAAAHAARSTDSGQWGQIVVTSHILYFGKRWLCQFRLFMLTFQCTH